MSFFFFFSEGLAGLVLVLSWCQEQSRGEKRIWSNRILQNLEDSKKNRTTRSQKKPQTMGILEQNFREMTHVHPWTSLQLQAMGQVAQASPKPYFSHVLHLHPGGSAKMPTSWAQLLVAGLWFWLEELSVGAEASVTPFIFCTETIVGQAFCLRARLRRLLSHAGLLKETQ